MRSRRFCQVPALIGAVSTTQGRRSVEPSVSLHGGSDCWVARILAYRVLTTEGHDQTDWNMLLMTEYKDLATMEAVKVEHGAALGRHPHLAAAR